jgi:hypothetical protein
MKLLVAIVGLLAVLGVGGYALGGSAAPDGGDAAGKRSEARAGATAVAEREAQADGRARGKRRGIPDGRRRGGAVGRRMGIRRGRRLVASRQEQQRQAQLAAAPKATPAPAHVVCDGAIADDAHYAACLRQSGEPVPPGLGGTDACPPGQAPATATGPCMPTGPPGE